MESKVASDQIEDIFIENKRHKYVPLHKTAFDAELNHLLQIYHS
jgi:hypothetical protein